jgi:hypothetical protein
MKDTVPEIRMATNHHDINIRKWIYRFNEKVIEGIIPRKHRHKPVKIPVDIGTKIVDVENIIPDFIVPTSFIPFKKRNREPADPPKLSTINVDLLSEYQL